MSSSKPKSKVKPSTDEDEPYHHPYLEEQIIVRFPIDIASDLIQYMNDSTFQDIEIQFNDKVHATLKIGTEVLNGVLVNLPTMVESHRSVNGSHLYKSADIGEILIVYRKIPPPIREDNTVESGITPPTVNILERREAQKESVRERNSDESNSIEGIEYWEMVEIQLSALLAKDKQAKPITRHEFFLEPDIDPIVLEKVLRTNKGPQYKGYSGANIPDEDLIKTVTEQDPIVHFREGILEEFQENKDQEDLSDADLLSQLSSAAPDSGSSSEEESSSGEEESSSEQTEEEKESKQESEQSEQGSPKRESSAAQESESESSSSDEEEEEENNIDSQIAALEADLAARVKRLGETKNENLQAKLKEKITQLQGEIAALKKKKEEEKPQ